MSSKSLTCSGKNGPLTEYFSETEAQECAEYVEQTHDKKMVPYQCDKCDMWHLFPKDRDTPSEQCPDCGKASYESESSAQIRASIRHEEDQVLLRVYECPHGNGWHLTKGAS